MGRQIEILHSVTEKVTFNNIQKKGVCVNLAGGRVLQAEGTARKSTCEGQPVLCGWTEVNKGKGPLEVKGEGSPEVNKVTSAVRRGEEGSLRGALDTPARTWLII